MKPYDMLTIKEISQRWDNRSHLWEQVILNPESEYNIDDGYEQFLICVHSACNELLNNQIKINMLDIGCGTGAVIKSILAYTSFALGIDKSKKMIAIAKEKIDCSNVEFKVLDCFEINKLKGPFTLITSRGILLSHYSKPKAKILLKNTFNVLDSNGIAIFDLLNKDATHKFYVSHKSYYCFDEIYKISSDLGFKCKLFNSPMERSMIITLKKS